jgi:hypothetical protein
LERSRSTKLKHESIEDLELDGNASWWYALRFSTYEQTSNGRNARPRIRGSYGDASRIKTPWKSASKY